MTEWIGAFLLVAGASFVLLAAIGLLRLPDVLARMQATSKATTLGLAGIMMGAAVHAGTTDAAVRALAIVLFTFMTAPVGAHVIGRAAYRTAGVPWRTLAVDEYAGSVAAFGAVNATAGGGAARGDQGPTVLACACTGEDPARLVEQAGLDRHFAPDAIDVLPVRDGSGQHPPHNWSGEALDRLAVSGHALLVVAPEEGRPALSPAARQLVRRSPVPVWFAAAAPGRRSRPRIVLGLDAPSDRRRAADAQRLLRETALMADAWDAEWHVVHACHPFGEDLLLRRATPDDRREYIAGEDLRARRMAEGLIAGAGLAHLPAALHVLHGERCAVLAEATRDLQADVLVIGTRGRRWPLTGLLIPPLAESIVPRVECGVLVAGPAARCEWVRARALREPREARRRA